MPEATFTSYLRLALKARGIDPDAEGGRMVADEAPPIECISIDDLPPESREALLQALGR